MTASASSGRPFFRSRRVRALALALVVLAGVAIVAAAGFNHTLTYYESPSDVVNHPPAAGQDFRLSGMVVRGSVVQHALTLRFALTDGAHSLRVVSTDMPPSTFRPGQDAVVQGWLARNGVFHATQVMVRHSNEYQPAKSSQSNSSGQS